VARGATVTMVRFSVYRRLEEKLRSIKQVGIPRKHASNSPACFLHTHKPHRTSKTPPRRP
jgi:hypothetical protein